MDTKRLSKFKIQPTQANPGAEGMKMDRMKAVLFQSVISVIVLHPFSIGGICRIKPLNTRKISRMIRKKHSPDAPPHM
jgi:hypothetical protein